MIEEAVIREQHEDSVSVAINMPPSPIPTPKRVNFSPLPSPNRLKLNASPGPSTKPKSSIKNLLPRLSFKFRNTNSDIEKAAIIALQVSPEMPSTSIPRTFSLSKLFTPKMDRTASLPTSPILHSNPESAHGGFPGVAAVSTSSLYSFICKKIGILGHFSSLVSTVYYLDEEDSSRSSAMLL